MRRMFVSVAIVAGMAALALGLGTACKGGGDNKAGGGGGGGNASGKASGGGSTDISKSTSGSCDEARMMAMAAERGAVLAVATQCNGMPKPLRELVKQTYIQPAPGAPPRFSRKSVAGALKQMWPKWEKLCPQLTAHSAELCLYGPGSANKACTGGGHPADIQMRAKELTKKCALHRHALFSESEAATIIKPHEGLMALSLYDWMTRSGGVSKGAAAEVVKAMIGVIAAVGCAQPFSAKCRTSLQHTGRFNTPLLRLGQGPTLRLPVSRASLALQRSTVVVITKMAIIVNDKKVVPVECMTTTGESCSRAMLDEVGNSFLVDKAYKTDGSEESFLIAPLHMRLGEIAKADRESAKQRGVPYQKPVMFVIDHQIPYRIVAEAVHSAIMAGFEELRFAVLNPANIREPLKVAAASSPSAEKLLADSTKRGHSAPPHSVVVWVGTDKLKIMGSFIKEKVPGLVGNIPKGPAGQHAYHLLYNRLRKNKALFAQKRQLLVGGSMATPWQDILAAMDAATTLLEADSYATADDYRKAKAATAGVRTPAFPKAFLTVSE